MRLSRFCSECRYEEALSPDMPVDRRAERRARCVRCGSHETSVHPDLVAEPLDPEATAAAFEEAAARLEEAAAAKKPAGPEEETRTCANCRHYYFGSCRAHPPRENLIFPAVAASMWCGEHMRPGESRAKREFEELVNNTGTIERLAAQFVTNMQKVIEEVQRAAAGEDAYLEDGDAPGVKRITFITRDYDDKKNKN